MEKTKNDATPQKSGDIFQYYIALRDCFEMEDEESIIIEALGDITKNSPNSKRSFQKEVKHHYSETYLTEKNIDFWKTISNWYIEYEKMKNYSELILYTTAIIKKGSFFYTWIESTNNEKVNFLINVKTKENGKEFNKYYNRIFNKEYNNRTFLSIVSKIKIESAQTNIKGVAKSFDKYLKTIPKKNQDQFIAALLGCIVGKVKEYPNYWKVSKLEFDVLVETVGQSYSNPYHSQLHLDFVDTQIPESDQEKLLQKKFVKEIKQIEYEQQIGRAISDYWRTESTIIKFYQDDLLYNVDIINYKKDMSERMEFIRDKHLLNTGEDDSRKSVIKKSKYFYLDVVNLEVKDFGSIKGNQSFFQRGIIHGIIEDGKIVWDLGE
jgi:hypothetical protein